MTLKCSCCGGKLQPTDPKGFYRCFHCGTLAFVYDSVSGKHTINIAPRQPKYSLSELRVLYHNSIIARDELFYYLFEMGYSTEEARMIEKAG